VVGTPRWLTHPGPARAAGHDTHPGDPEQLHRYWVAGPGLAKWRASPQPWTTLYHHLLKWLPDGEAKRTAAKWFHEVMGFWPGADLNRVTHGKPPRGHKVGPG
jgi:hypothetical protein